jgi:FtsH-binding integral membrane protein
VNLYLGLGLFSVFVAYDTQRMIDKAAQGEEDHVSDALNMFLNLFNIFIRLLMIFGRRD